MKKLSILLGIVLVFAAVGCESSSTSNSDVNAAAQELSKKSAGTPDAPPAGQVFGGGGGGAKMGKPHR